MMPDPSSIDIQIRRRFDELVTRAEQLVEYAENDPIPFGSAASAYTTGYFEIKTNLINLIQRLATKRNTYAELLKDVRSTNIHIPAELLGIILGLKNDYETGLLRNIAEMIETNVSADYLEQAEGLLHGSKPGEFNHVPAAVLAGAVLEDSLRRLCLRQTPPILTNKPNGQSKNLNALIDDLKSVELISELKAKQLRAWADIRNAAAHGRFEEFKRADVEQMLNGVRTFLADYM